MKLYEVTLYVTYYNKRKKKYEEQERSSVFIVDNLDYAKEVYKEYLGRYNMYVHMEGYSGFCRLFIPHVFENGLLAQWGDEYILQEEMDN